MAIELARREALKLAAEAEDDAAQAGELAVDEALEDAGAEDVVEAEAEPTDADVTVELPVEIHRDPLDWLAQAAGFEDGETWWNRLVEERGDSESLFESINEAMTAVRSELAKDGEHWRGEAYVQREALRTPAPQADA